MVRDPLGIEGVHRAIRVRAAERDTTMETVMREALVEAFAEGEEHPGETPHTEG